MYKKYLSIIIPVLNEAENIKPIYNNVINFKTFMIESYIQQVEDAMNMVEKNPSTQIQ